MNDNAPMVKKQQVFCHSSSNNGLNTLINFESSSNLPLGEALGEALSFLHVIDLVKSSCTSRYFLEVSTKVLRDIESIELRNVPLIDDNGVMALLKRCSQLKHLDLSVRRLSPQGLQALARAPLDRLLLSNGQHFEPNHLAVLLGQGIEGPSSLRLLSLLNFRAEWTTAQIQAFFHQHPRLEGLALYNYFIRLTHGSYADPELWQSLSLSGQLLRVQELSFSPLYAVDLQGLLEYAPNLRSLTCFLEDAITDHLCSSFALCTPNIKEINLRDDGPQFPDLSNDGLQALARCTSLEKLKLIRTKGNYRECSDLGIVYLAMKCLRLGTLTLQGFSKLSDTALSAICTNLKNLEHLHLQGCRSLTGWAFYPSCSKQRTLPKWLKTLNLSQCREIGSEAVDHVIRQCRYLEDLNVAACSVDDSFLPYLRLSPSLSILCLMSCSITDAGLCALADKHVKENEVWTDDEIKERLAACSKLQLIKFGVRGCWKVSDAGLCALITAGLFEKLESLDLTGLSSLSDNCVLMIAQKCPFLLHVKLKDCTSLTDRSIEYLQSAACSKNLTVLYLSKCSKMSGFGLYFLFNPHFPRLTYVDLENFPAKKQDIEALAENKPDTMINSSVLPLSDPEISLH